MDAVAPLQLGRVEQKVEQGVEAEHAEHEPGRGGEQRQGRAQKERAGERGLRHRVEAQVERVDGKPEADHGAAQDPGDVGQEAAQVDPARVEPPPQAAARGPLDGEMDEGVRHCTWS